MTFIKLTLKHGLPIYVSAAHIAELCRVEPSHGACYTSVITTGYEGVSEVQETPEEIIKKIGANQL